MSSMQLGQYQTVTRQFRTKRTYFYPVLKGGTIWVANPILLCPFFVVFHKSEVNRFLIYLAEFEKYYLFLYSFVCLLRIIRENVNTFVEKYMCN
jgi:hypothetical protein